VVAAGVGREGGVEEVGEEEEECVREEEEGGRNPKVQAMKD